LIGAGITAVYAAPAITHVERTSVEQVLNAMGKFIWVENETLLDAVTAVSGSGPAYVFYFIEALQQAALELGMTTVQARTLALHTFLGASRLAAQSEDSPAALRTKVTSKGGTTERALAAMEADQLKSKFIDAVKAAAARSKELGEEFGKD
jgi:pyrroline-5-carboxylate reductase